MSAVFCRTARRDPGNVATVTNLRELGKTTGKPYKMQDDEFEWDDAKAARNRNNHGVGFDLAREAFRDAFMVDWVDDRHGVAEPRFAMLGMVEHRLLFVAYTLRGDRIRIISARKAEPHEQRRYHEDNREA